MIITTITATTNSAVPSLRGTCAASRHFCVKGFVTSVLKCCVSCLVPRRCVSDLWGKHWLTAVFSFSFLFFSLSHPRLFFFYLLLFFFLKHFTVRCETAMTFTFIINLTFILQLWIILLAFSSGTGTSVAFFFFFFFFFYFVTLGQCPSYINKKE